MNCKSCHKPVDELAVFPGGICLARHEIKFNEQVRRDGGRLPRPDFTKAFSNPAKGGAK